MDPLKREKVLEWMKGRVRERDESSRQYLERLVLEDAERQYDMEERLREMPAPIAAAFNAHYEKLRSQGRWHESESIACTWKDDPEWKARVLYGLAPDLLPRVEWADREAHPHRAIRIREVPE